MQRVVHWSRCTFAADVCNVLCMVVYGLRCAMQHFAQRWMHSGSGLCNATFCTFVHGLVCTVQDGSELKTNFHP